MGFRGHTTIVNTLDDTWLHLTLLCSNAQHKLYVLPATMLQRDSISNSLSRQNFLANMKGFPLKNNYCHYIQIVYRMVDRDMNARGRQRMIARLGKPVKGVVGGHLYRERECVCLCVLWWRGRLIMALLCVHSSC